jgi:hypothetical protein
MNRRGVGNRRLWAGAVALSLLGLAEPAFAAPLDQNGLDQLQLHVD